MSDVRPLDIYLVGYGPEDAIVRGWVYTDPRHAQSAMKENQEDMDPGLKTFELRFIPPPEALTEVEF